MAVMLYSSDVIKNEMRDVPKAPSRLPTEKKMIHIMNHPLIEQTLLVCAELFHASVNMQSTMVSLFLCRQPDHKFASFRISAVHCDQAAVVLNHFFYDGESHPCSASICLDLDFSMR